MWNDGLHRMGDLGDVARLSNCKRVAPNANERR